MDPQLQHVDGQAPAHDDLEGPALSPSLSFPRAPPPSEHRTLPPPLALVGLQGKIAVHKNHASEADVSESDLNLGLFAYPVLQAADILLYKLRLLPFPSSFPPPSFPPED